jgi:tetratricopeptide (TPR) repeat protein
MNSKFAMILAAALSAVGLVVGTGAGAQESVSVLGNHPATICSEQAAGAIRTGTAPTGGIDACDDAIKHAALTAGELAATYVNRGVLDLTAGNYAAAIADNDSALRIRGDLAEAFANRGAALAAEKRPAQAIGDFDRALAANPAHPAQIHFNRALAREDLGDLKGAYLDYLKAAELDPSWNLPKQELARFTVAKPAQG